MTHANNKNIYLTVFTAALGYFVDIYDLQLFNVISKASLRGIGITDPAQVDIYDYQLFLWQMFGMLVGGLIWGIIGDRKGRKSVLFASIIIYSLANIANGFVTDTTTYSILRFIAGFGLAGELGAAITLTSELMSKETRGYGTMLIVGTGALGAVAAAFVSKFFVWQHAYFIGGGLGLMLLFLRFSTFESGMFEQVQQDRTIQKGNFFSLFQTPKRAITYLACIFSGLPIWFCIAILIKFSPKIAEINQIQGKISIADTVMYCYIGLSVGDFICGWLSQIFRSRKKVVIAYLLATILMVYVLLFTTGWSVSIFNVLCFLLGCCTGYWALFVTIASEQFGTNIRSTVTTTVPNFVRGSVIPITLLFKTFETSQGTIYAAFGVGIGCLVLAFISMYLLEETFGKDLNYNEK